MKKYLILLIFLPGHLFGQVDMGTMQVNDKFTVTLLFPSEISFVVWGNNPAVDVSNGMTEYAYYSMFQNGKTLIIKANRMGLEKTSINVKTEDETLWYGFVENADSDRLFYDFTGKSPVKTAVQAQPAKDSANHIETAAKISEKDYEQKLSYVMSRNVEYNDLGLMAGHVSFMVTNIMNDPYNMYVKIIINNQSGNAFEVNSVVFKHVEGKTKGIKRNQVQNEERLMPLYEQTVRMIPAYTKQELGYVLPLFSTGKDGKFIIQFIEEHGTRNYQIEIKSREMQKVNVFKL